LWVIDFPLFSWNDEENRLEPENHPFTSPHFDDIEFLEKKPLAVRSLGYDLVLNGFEISSGSQRIHDSRLQERIFRLLGYTEEERILRFGFFVEALTYGTPPHLGMALGLDRIVMILAGTENIRDVVAFPKNQRAVDLMTIAPSEVTADQLKELGITLEV
jgi:aspartyl-tRNA synthetase